MVQKAVRLVGEGEISRAANLLTSEGLADITDPEIIDQLRRKHLDRKKQMPGNLPAKTRPQLRVRCKGAYAKLPRRCGTGVDNKPNEYLSVLDRDFDNNAKANEAILHHEKFAGLFVNDKLPRWYYKVQSASLLVASIKNEPGGGATPDVRPIAMGNVGPRAWAAVLAEDGKELFRDKLQPIQVAIGMPGGISVMAFASRALLEQKPTFAGVGLDMENAYGRAERAEVLNALEEDPELSIYAPFFHCTYSPYGPIFLGQDLADFESKNGGRQGDPFFTSVYCAASQKANKKLADTMKAAGGAAFFDVDDGFIIGPIDVVFTAARQYALDVEEFGGKLNIGKSCSYSVAYGVNLAAQPGYDADFPVKIDENGEPGIKIGGVPVGTDEYVKAALTKKVDSTMSNIMKISTKLQHYHLQTLYTVLAASSQHKVEFWAQHCYPTDTAGPMADFDTRLEDHIKRSHGGDFVMDDLLLNRRQRLPIRLRGGGMRRMAKVALAGFVAMASLALPQCIDSVSNGVVRAGAAPALEGILGAGSFDEANTATRFATLGASNERLGKELRQSWTTMQLETNGTTSQPDDFLSAPFAAAGAKPTDGKVERKLQKALTREREEVEEEHLSSLLAALPHPDARRTAWYSVDEYSSQILTGTPAVGDRLRNDEWSEGVAMYFGAPSPACAPHVGEPITVNGRNRAPLDQNGALLLSLNCIINIKNGRTIWHDELKHRVRRQLQQGHVEHECEVYNLFAAEMPSEGRRRAFAQHSTITSRQGSVPDLMWADGQYKRLGDFKTMGLCSTWYPARRLQGGARGKCVMERANAVNKAMVRQAKQLDEKFCGVTGGAVGPVQRKLLSFGPVVGIVFGAFGEVSEGVWI